jgi:hypothetical protein
VRHADVCGDIGQVADSIKTVAKISGPPMVYSPPVGGWCDQVLSSDEFLAWKEFIFMGRAVFPEEHFKITAGEADLLPENFGNVNTICACLRAREPRRQGAARG